MIILVFVYWFLLKIIREYSWNVSVKEVGSVRIIYMDYISVYLQIFVIRIWLYIFINFMILWSKIILIFVLKYHKFQDENIAHELFFSNILRFFIGVEVFSGVKNPKWVLFWNFQEIEKLVLDRYIFTFLNNYPCNISYFYELPFEFLAIQKFKHSFFSELIWAIFPTIIVVLILAPSLYLLYSIDEELDPMLTIKVIGHQWYWTYELNDWIFQSSNPSNSSNKIPSYYNLFMEFDSILINEDLLNKGSKRLLEVNKSLIVPINIPIRFLITSTDVLHSWSIPELGLKIDAVPGRLNQFLSVICRTGRLYGQCSELCGVSHAFMPIVMDGVKFDIFTKFANNFIQNFNFKSNIPITLSLVNDNIPSVENDYNYNELLPTHKNFSLTNVNNLIEDWTTNELLLYPNGLSIEKQYNIILFIRELLDNPTDKNGNPLTEAKLFAHLKRSVCLASDNESQELFFKFLWKNMEHRKFSAWDMFIFFDQIICQNYLIKALNINELMLHSNRLSIEKQYNIILFIRELLDNPTDKNGNPLTEAKLFEYSNKIICVYNNTEAQELFYTRLRENTIGSNRLINKNFTKLEMFTFLDDKVCNK